MKEQIYTSTGGKLLYHPDVVSKILELGIATPISLQIAPTSKCNLKCVFCSNAHRTSHEHLCFDNLLTLLREMTKLGLKTVEWTGGGEPTLYPEFVHAVGIATTLGLKQGLITNGITLKDYDIAFLNQFTWIRISMNSLDYVDEIIIPEGYQGTLGFSYVWNEKSDIEAKRKLFYHVLKYSPKYVRVVPNCQATYEEQEKNNSMLSKMIETWKEPFFYQAKHFSEPERCYWGYLKPFVLHNGWVYPCSSVVLNDDADKSFHAKYQWVRMEDLPFIYKNKMKGRKWGCSHCVFRQQNDMVSSLLNPHGQEDFI